MNPHLLEKYRTHVQDQLALFEQVDVSKEVGYLARFAFFSANLANFLPDIASSSHHVLFQKNLFNTALETADRSIPYLAEVSNFEGQTALVLQNPSQPFIYCTFHLGSYRLLFNWLFRLERNLIILVRQAIFEQQLQDIMAFKDVMVAQYGIKSDIRVVNADEPTSALKMLRLLRDGYSLVAYIDANHGTGADKGEPVSFLQHSLFVRRGLPFLSLAANLPIVPVASYRTSDWQNTLCVGEPIYPDKSVSKEIFETKTLQQLYDWLGNYVARFPDQWEVWNYLHDFMLPVPAPALLNQETAFQKTTYRFNDQRYALFVLESGPVLFDRSGYDINEISTELYDYLSGAVLAEPQSILGISVFQDLVTHQVIL